jgi:hypothetical protein
MLTSTLPGKNRDGSSSQVSLFNYESDFQLDAVFHDFPFIIQLELLILDPCGLEILEGFLSTSYFILYGIFETFR